MIKNIRELGILIFLLLMIAVFSFLSPNFLTGHNLMSIASNNVVLGIMAIGMTLVIIIGGIDVSVGALLACVSFLVGKLLFIDGANMILILIAGILIGGLLGLMNGALIGKTGIPAIVITLGTMSIFRGGIYQYSEGRWITGLPGWYRDFGTGKIILIPIPVLVLIAVAIFTAWLLRYTSLGRKVYAVGGDPISATRIGINKSQIQIIVFTYMGLLTGISGAIYGAQFGSIMPSTGMGLELSVIAAVVIGGANIFGGSGSVSGTLIGVAIIGVIENGLILAGAPTYWKEIMVGSIILIAIIVDLLQRKRLESTVTVIDVMEVNNEHERYPETS